MLHFTTNPLNHQTEFREIWYKAGSGEGTYIFYPGI